MVKRGREPIMQVQFLEEGERLIARPQGRMEAADGTDFAAAVEQRLTAAIKSVTIDLEELEFINFGGIRALLRLARSLIGGKRKLDFVGGGHAVREHLDQAGLDDFFPFTPPFISNRGIPRWDASNSSLR
jgi:anti-anti-sigma factor